MHQDERMTDPVLGIKSLVTNHNLRVALVCMPFCAADRPSIQIGLLTAIAEQAGFPVDAFHLNLELASRLTPSIYDALCAHRGRMTGEWLFSIAAFGEGVDSNDTAYYSAFPGEIVWAEKGGKDAAYLSSLRHEILPRFIEDCLEMIDWGRYHVIGFSSTFQQNVACLALARRIKECYPYVKTVFGGANMEGEMGSEYVRVFQYIDYVVVGEGDLVFPALLERIAAKQSPRDLQGVVWRTEWGIQSNGQAPPIRRMDALPVPNYDEYFERVHRLGLDKFSHYVWAIPFESSRGCWWGEKHHCTFCGLNGLGMDFRSKSPERVFTELSIMARKYRISFFEATDNILDMKYIKQFFTTIRQTKTDYQFFYEVKANLNREQIQTLYSGGVRSIQPGIESLSSHVLQLMRKGCTMLQNLRLLKWCRYYRIRIGWNLIWGFPGETEEDYRQELEILKLITHLEPPKGCGTIWMERFSPYFTDRELFPVHDLRPESSYSFAYPPQLSLKKAAYFFDHEMDGTVTDEIHCETREWVNEWKQRWASEAPDTLFYRRTRDALFIDDNRGANRRGSYAFYSLMADIYEFCSETMRTVPQVVEYLDAHSEADHFGDDHVREALDEYCRLGLMVSEESKYFSLALPVNPNW